MAELIDSDWKYKITIYEKDWEQVQRWCEINIGEFGQGWYKLGIDIALNIFENDNRTTWLFKEEKDVIMFKLRWA